jgi:hypothetical protein
LDAPVETGNKRDDWCWTNTFVPSYAHDLITREQLMPVIEYFPYLGPNRRSDKTVVEIILDFGPDEEHDFPQHASEIRDLLVAGGILAAEENFPAQDLPEERMAWYSSLLS